MAVSRTRTASPPALGQTARLLQVGQIKSAGTGFARDHDLQSCQEGKVMASPLRVAHVTVVVTSLDLSMRYYAALLPLIGFMEESYGIWSDGAGFHLKFLEAAAGGPSTRSNAVGIAHLGFSAPAPEFLDEIRDAMAAAGFSGAEVQSLNGCISLFLEDPDGIRIEIIHHRAGPDAGTDPGARPGKTDVSRGLPHPPGLY